MLGTFRVVASSRRPLEDSAITALDPACPDCGAWATDETRIDLRERAGRDTALYAGVQVHAARATVAHVFVGFEGELRILLDGREVLREARFREREDDVHAALTLTPGVHRVVFAFHAPEEGRWRARVRMLDADFAPGLDLDLGPGEVTSDLASDSVAVTDTLELDSDHVPRVRLRAARPAGGLAVSVPVAFDEVRAALAPGGTLEHVVPLPARGALRVHATIDASTVRIGRGLSLDRPLAVAAGELLRAIPEAPPEARASIQWRAEEAMRVIAVGDPDRHWRQWLRGEARRIPRELAAGRDPFPMHGYQRVAHASTVDATAQPYELFVPPAYRADREWPLVVTLHGFKGNAGDYFRNTFGIARDYEARESLVAHGRSGTPPTTGPMIVIAPEGRGQTHYRHAGEIDVLEAIADIRSRLNVDPRRIYVTGGSMGGTGAAYLPLRHPDLFAASAALAGYHDQRVRQDTHHETLTAAERFLRAERSDIDWAENALHLPWLLVRGTRDRPLAWTRRFAVKLRELDYAVEHREPDLGHNVWTETYAEGAIFDWFARHRRPEDPARVRLVTARERTTHSYWVTIDGRAFPDRFARVDARRIEGEVAGGTVQVEATTEAVAGVTFSPAAARMRLRIDGQEFEGAVPMSLCRRHRGGVAGPWRLHRLPTEHRKRAGVSGPIRDAFHENLLFVVGTQDPRHTLVNRAVAEDWAHPLGWDVRYPIVDDVDVTSAMIAEHSLVLIGPPASNALTARWNARLPIRIESDSIRVGERRHRGAEVGVAFVAPNPDAPDRMLLVLAGPTPLGTWRSRFLPDVLPDYVVFDERIALARGAWSCGGARRDDGTDSGGEPVPCQVIEEGFFDMVWHVRARAVPRQVGQAASTSPSNP